MIMLCIRGAVMLILIVASCIFWAWLLAPLPPRGRYGTPEYFQWKMDTFTAMFGGFGLLIAVAFCVVVAYHYMSR